MPVEILRERVLLRVPPSVTRAVLETLESAGEIVIAGEFVKTAGHRTELTPDEIVTIEKIHSIYKKARFEVPRIEEVLSVAATATGTSREQTRKLFQMQIDSGEIVKVTEEFYFSKKAIDSLKGSLRSFSATTSDSLIDVAQFKEITGLSRKYAIPLLEYFDRIRITMRTGDKRKII